MAPTGYAVPVGPAEVELRFRNSRFIGTTGPVSTVEEARAYIQRVRDQYPDASHHVYAFAVGFGASVTHGMSDDGEPSGTAGRPVLVVLQGAAMGDLAVVVTRYFGGTKLGTGGLVRAYTATAQAVLAEVVTAIKTTRITVAMSMGYGDFDVCRSVIERMDAEVLTEDFGERVQVSVRVAEAEWGELRRQIVNATAGRVDPVPAEG